MSVKSVVPSNRGVIVSIIGTICEKGVVELTLCKPNAVQKSKKKKKKKKKNVTKKKKKKLVGQKSTKGIMVKPTKLRSTLECVQEVSISWIF
jgi:hypothetical protein